MVERERESIWDNLNYLHLIESRVGQSENKCNGMGIEEKKGRVEMGGEVNVLKMRGEMIRE